MTVLTVGEVIEESVRALAQAAVDDARLDARLIVAHALNWTPERVFGYPEQELEGGELNLIRELIARRVKREPLALITGEKEFWSLRFTVGPETLIPRPDSETLIDAVLAAYPDREKNLRILDLGTGSGCLLLTLLHEYVNASGMGTDFSQGALKIARGNAKNMDLSMRAGFVLSDWNQGVSQMGNFDIVISNPPYVPQGDESSLQPEVLEYEPHSALFAGSDGLMEYRTIISHLPGLLDDEGMTFFEVGIDQAKAVSQLMEAAGMKDISCRHDLAGIERCVWGKM